MVKTRTEIRPRRGVRASRQLSPRSQLLSTQLSAKSWAENPLRNYSHQIHRLPPPPQRRRRPPPSPTRRGKFRPPPRRPARRRRPHLRDLPRAAARRRVLVTVRPLPLPRLPARARRRDARRLDTVARAAALPVGRLRARAEGAVGARAVRRRRRRVRHEALGAAPAARRPERAAVPESIVRPRDDGPRRRARHGVPEVRHRLLLCPRPPARRAAVRALPRGPKQSAKGRRSAPSGGSSGGARRSTRSGARAAVR